ncbi:SET domain-containing protein [Candidatus Microgenomates bacterium]|nr:SET domain-containing protein [Candidatus Microgenomates bacterium]
MFLLSDDYWKVSKTNQKGNGIIAKKSIPQGTVIGDYLGRVVNIAEYDLDSDKSGLYLMYYTDQACIYPDRTKPGIHLLNHSCEPNCWIYTYHGHSLFFAIRDIAPGEELTIMYLLSPLDNSCKNCPHNCLCGATRCTKTMHLPKDVYLRWQKFHDAQMKKTTIAPFVFGKNLEPLQSYPLTIPVDPIYSEIVP